jgi:cytochrome c oxidase subunit 3
MVTKVQETTETVVERERGFDIAPIRPRSGRGPRGGGGGPNGGGGGPNGGGGGGGNEHDSERDWSPDRFRLGVYVGIVSILVMFGALGLAYALRMTNAPAVAARRGFELPYMLWLSTGLIITSSFTFSAARYKLRRGQAAEYWGWLAATLLLGFSFILSQVLAWRQLAVQEFFFATNPQSTFFYILTALHALHLFGGIVALSLLLLHARRRLGRPAQEPKTVAYTDAVGLYWHFMDLLWLGILALLIFES